MILKMQIWTRHAHFSAMAAATEVCAFRKIIIAALKVVNEYAFVEMPRD
jgi:hypothetical protein